MARNPDSGAKLIWRDVASATLRSWDTPNTTDERSQTFAFDALRRPTERWVRLRSPNGDISSLVEETTYGESLPDAKARNARGQAYSHKDGAGIATDQQRDFQGKVTRSVRQLTTSTTKAVPDWSKSVAIDETFTTLTTYDALGRVTRIDTPHNNNVPASQVYPIYNEANLLDRVEASLRGATTRTTFVQNIDYDAKGQRQRITYGNRATTRYQYDPNTWRLTNLLTTRNGGSDTLQNLSYTYDATGNVVQITDAAQQTVFFNNQVVEATALYEYDATYRLTKATGREHINHGAATEPEAEGFNTPQNLPSDGQSLRNYTRQWTYDHVGNILSLLHTATNGNWTRNYTYANDSNRLATTTVGTTTQTYTHNAHGSFTSMPHLDTMDWTPDERLYHVKRGTSETWYTYDSTGQRVRKYTEKGGFTEERLYLGGWEIYRKRQGSTVVLERESLHILDGNRRVALIETKTIDTATTSPLPRTVTRYQLDNHLQSASLELDETAQVISYEEYYPYGDTSYRSARSGTEVSEKRYRYTGKEKDEETGLYYHGARYYAAWLGRWTAADPAGMVDGASLYAYVRNHPTGLVDPDGRAGERPEPGKIRLSHGDYDRNTWNPSSISRPQIDHDPSGLRHSLQFPKGEPPTPYPKEKLGSLDYYKFRHDDFVRRNPKSNAPEYYLNYGDKYAKRFTEETKSTLSKAGQIWLDKARINLQKAIEDRLDPAKQPDVNSFERKNAGEDFKEFAFGSHVDAYWKAGLNELPTLDLVKISLTPDFKDLMSPEGIDQVQKMGMNFAKYWADNPTVLRERISEGVHDFDKIKDLISEKAAKEGVPYEVIQNTFAPWLNKLILSNQPNFSTTSKLGSNQ